MKIKNGYKIINVRGYYRKVILKESYKDVEAKKWVEPYIRKIKIKVDNKQKTVEEYEM